MVHKCAFEDNIYLRHPVRGKLSLSCAKPKDRAMNGFFSHTLSRSRRRITLFDQSRFDQRELRFQLRESLWNAGQIFLLPYLLKFPGRG